VAWAAERNNAQALFFCLLAWWLQVGGARGEQPWPRLVSPAPARYAGVWFAYAAALLSKPLAVGFAPVLILTELFLMAGAGRFVRAVGLAFPALVAAWWALSAAGRNILPLVGGSYAAWALTGIALLGRYVTQVFVPWPLSFFYGIEPVRGVLEPRVWLAAGLLGCLALSLAARRVEWRRGAVLGLGALLALAPSLSPRTHSYLFQDRYLYFALPSAVALMTVALGTWTGTPRATRVRAGAVAALCAVFAALAFSRSADFRSAEALFRDAADKEPRSYFAHYFLAQNLYKRALREEPAQARGLLEEAAHHIRATHEAVDRERNARGTTPLFLEGSILLALGSPAAQPVLRKVVEEAGPGETEVRLKALEFLVELARREYARTRDRERLEEAVPWLLRILETRPAYAEARIRLAEAYERLGEKDAARAEYERLRDHPRLGAQARAALQRLSP
jgi:tetratricopeptide (TPR) repeat protein